MARKTTKAQGQIFSIHAPDATTVLLAGNFTHWQTEALPMKKIKQGNWSITVPLEPGTYHYRFIVDGQWQDDPACTIRVANSFGTQDNVRSVE